MRVQYHFNAMIVLSFILPLLFVANIRVKESTVYGAVHGYTCDLIHVHTFGWPTRLYESYTVERTSLEPHSSGGVAPKSFSPPQIVVSGDEILVTGLIVN